MFQGIVALLLAALVEAAPMSAQAQDLQGYSIGGGIVGFIVLILDIIVWYEVITSNRPILHKVLWSLLVFILPLGGALIYFLVADRKGSRRGYEIIP